MTDVIQMTVLMELAAKLPAGRKLNVKEGQFYVDDLPSGVRWDSTRASLLEVTYLHGAEGREGTLEFIAERLRTVRRAGEDQ